MATKQKFKILRLPAVRELSGLATDSIYRLGREGRFPKRVKISERASGWLEHEVEEWIANLPRATESAKVGSTPAESADSAK